MTRDSEPFFQPANSSGDSQRTGPDSSAVSQPSAGKPAKDSSIHRSSSSERTSPDKVASQQKSAGKLRSMSTSQGRTGPDNASQKHQSTWYKHSTTCYSCYWKLQAAGHRPSPLRPTFWRRRLRISNSSEG